MVVDELLTQGKRVRAVVRPATDPSGLKAPGAGIARGDMLDRRFGCHHDLRLVRI